MVKCPKCQRNPAPIHPQWGVIWCKDCNDSRDKTKIGGYPEFIPDHVKEERPKYLKSMLQSHRQGELSREFVEANPERVKGMVKEGVLSNREVKKAKKVWPELKGWENTQ